MSPREETSNKIVKFLEENPYTFNAPYGVVTGFRKLTKGVCRTIAFGVACYLDADIWIWTPTNIRISACGPLCG